MEIAIKRAKDFNPLNIIAIYTGPIAVMHPNITTGELDSLKRSGRSFILLDVQGRGSFAKEHIAGAVNVPSVDIEKEVPGLAGWDDLIVVCSRNSGCMASAVAVDKLITLGYKKVLRYAEGVAGWKSAGLSAEGPGEIEEDLERVRGGRPSGGRKDAA